jgi:hypothetical protein
VAAGLLGEREGDAGAERVDIGRTGRALVLEPLVALDAAVGGVGGVEVTGAQAQVQASPQVGIVVND